MVDLLAENSAAHLAESTVEHLDGYWADHWADRMVSKKDFLMADVMVVMKVGR